MKKVMYPFFLFVLLIHSAILQAQAAADIFDPFYEDLSVWEKTNLIYDTVPERPYPLQEIKRILNLVMQNGDTVQQKAARAHYERFFGKVFHAGSKTEFAAQIAQSEQTAQNGLPGAQNETEIDAAAFCDFNYFLNNALTLSARGGALFTDRFMHNALVPAFRYSSYDLAVDYVHVGSLYLLPFVNSVAAIGNPNCYLSAGITRTNSAPFFNGGIVTGAHAMHQGRFNFVFRQNNWTYSQSFLTLSASDNKGQNLSPGKFAMLHSLTIQAFRQLSFGITDTVIYGGRFEPLYVVPFSAFFMSQGLYAFPDNSLIGVQCSVKPLKGLQVNAQVYADDIGFNQIITFKKDAKWRLSGQFGVSYAASGTFPFPFAFACADLDYTFVTPYTYTHADIKDAQYSPSHANYQNYTHNGAPLGSNLQPNSDRVRLSLQFRPLRFLNGLSIKAEDSFIRHGNVSESVSDIRALKDYLSNEYATDGSVFNHASYQIVAPGGVIHKDQVFAYATPFLNQKTVQYVNQLELELNYRTPIVRSAGYVQFKLSYVFETNLNPKVGTHIYQPDGTTDGWKTKTVEQIGHAIIEQKAAQQLQNWRQQAQGYEVKHYIRLGAEIVY